MSPDKNAKKTLDESILMNNFDKLMLKEMRPGGSISFSRNVKLKASADYLLSGHFYTSCYLYFSYDKNLIRKHLKNSLTLLHGWHDVRNLLMNNGF